MTNRKQKVRIDQRESEPITITMSENSILSYADDTAVISSGKTWKEVESEMNQLLEKVAIGKKFRYLY